MQLLVVCTANIARSPLAASMLAASLAPLGIEVHSAGMQARPGHPAAESSQEQAKRRDLDLSEHRSQPVTPESIRDADLVLTMSEHHRNQCASLAAEGSARVFTLRELVRLIGGLDLQDAPSDTAKRLAWLTEQAHHARSSASPPQTSEDVYDPIRDPEAAWVAMGATLDELCGRVVEALGGTRAWAVPPTALGEHDDRGSDRRRRPRWLGGLGV